MREVIMQVLENTENQDIGFRSCLEGLADELAAALESTTGTQEQGARAPALNANTTRRWTDGTA